MSYNSINPTSLQPINSKKDFLNQFLDFLVHKSLEGIVRWDRNLLNTIEKAIQNIDDILSKQMDEIIHSAAFLELEGHWNGLYYLVKNSNTSPSLKIKILNTKKEELEKDFGRINDIDQSEIFKKIYEYEFGSSGGEPYGLLVGDY